MIAGAELRVPDRDVVLLHVVLHAAHHVDQVNGKPLEDLRRALALVEETEWCRALELAPASGRPCFSSGPAAVARGRGSGP